MCSSTLCITWPWLLFAASFVLYSPHLAPCGEAAGQDSMRQNQDDRLSHLSNYEIVMPTRLDLNGHPLPVKSRHFHKRSAPLPEENWYWWDNNNDDNNIGTKEENGFLQNATYYFEAFGERFNLNLTKDASLISPSLVLEFIGNGKSGAMDTETPTHCFYSGRVNGHPESSAVLSLCLGMYGLLETRNGSKYFMEPLSDLHQKPTSSNAEDGFAVPHIIYSSDELLKNHGPNQGCGLTDEDFAQNKHHLHHNNINERWNGKNSLGTGVSGLFNSISQRLKEKELLEKSSIVFNGSTEGDAHHRSKRYISYERFVELMVVADSKMVQHHDRNVQHYILTLVALVNRIFRDPSIGNNINIVLVKLLVLERDEDGPEISSDAPRTLRNFCIWQQSQNPAEDSHPHHFDTAVLITRQDICRSATDCDTLGLAELGTMCDAYRSCSIVEDNGLSAAFTMAHELGHVFNLPHDDNYKCREQASSKTYNYAVMAPTLNYHTSPWTWSNCSRNELTEFLDMDYGQCLLDKPSDSQPLPTYLPGEVYNVSKQCELVFGGGSTICPYHYMRNCKRLWCRGSSWGKTMGCRTQHMPWADGTPCQHHNSWCYRGECMKKNTNPEVVDGGWGAWGSYGDCSRTCGGGIRQSSRKCDSPLPLNGGQYCIGVRTRFRSCNIRSCPDNEPSIREVQCAAHNGKHYNIKGLPSNVRWEAKYDGLHLSEQCKLICKVAGSTAYYQLAKKVIDGTPCSNVKDDICVQGRCLRAGCDHILGSDTQRDECGVCGGDGSSCKTVTGKYNKQQHGYNEVVSIPKGSRKIEISQESFNGRPEDDNYLAVMNQNSQFVLNGNFIINLFEREIRVGKTLIKYTGSGNVVEKIICNDVLDTPITVYVLSAGNLLPPQINYTYNVPLDIPIYTWNRYGKWGQCSTMCNGVKTREITCVRESDRTHVPDQYCSSTVPRPMTKPCNKNCVLNWEVTGQNECSSQCGRGRKNQRVQCIKRQPKRGTMQAVGDQYCAEFERPQEVIECMGPCDQTYWKYTDWTPCSQSCGGGLRRRSAACRDSRGRRAPTSSCDRNEMHTQEECNTQECPAWITGDWTSCSVTCGVGQQQREIACYIGQERRSDSECEREPRPDDRQSCQESECPFWQYGAWGPCSATCGIGYQRRAIRCRLRDGQMVDEHICHSEERPTDMQECNEVQCRESTTAVLTTYPTTTQLHTYPAAPQRRIQTVWRIGSWTTCTKTCGSGTRKRYVSCRDVYDNEVHEDECGYSEKPSSFEVCNNKPCPQWRTGEWNQCPVTCGQGMTTRYVACVFSDNVITNDFECASSERPNSERTCNLQECARNEDHSNYPVDNRVIGESHWRTGTWSECSRTCGGGWRRRLVLCQDRHGDANSCDISIKPEEIESCNREPCPLWNYGEWGACTASCGGGFKRRLVICMLRSGQTVNDSTCNMSQRPEDTAPCNTSPCRTDRSRATYRRGPWRPCSVTCGEGIKRRSVTCEDKEGRLYPDKWCEGKKPTDQKTCKRSSCAKWDNSEWSQCSTTCGKGLRVRQVRCISKDQEVDESECTKEKPVTIKGCRKDRCPGSNRNRNSGNQKQSNRNRDRNNGNKNQNDDNRNQDGERTTNTDYSWKKGKWTGCSKTCGRGEKYRHIYCVDRDGGRVQDDLCTGQHKPGGQRACEEDPCPGTRVDWIEGQWSECSTSCSLGQQTRSVTCQVFGEDGWPQDDAVTGCDDKTKPIETKECNYGDCSQDTYWIIGGWSECSRTCGVGIQKRKVDCRSRSGKRVSHHDCRDTAIKPDAEQVCHSEPCKPTSCHEVQQLYGANEDKEYTLQIQERPLSVYCYNMASTAPIEFISLLAGETENFSEMYPKRLIRTDTCPYNGNRNDACDCIEEGDPDAGLSTFSKVRVLLPNLEVIITDSTFANTRYGRFVPYASAGDCYSVAQCPQGRFHINLAGTGLTVAPETSWIEQGSSVTIRINKTQNNERIAGQCGGDCGKCIPDRRKGGLRLMFLT
ncbi:A disintegrin and metalloproteinase with thrombospondin motifs 9-like isoform X2 [Amphiura filiformis]|uniref:A disintegrin and metalloproteinase with thrombospondin motifs 9-like isoform X2 n=1 Tax=Amphiura filiformis TaxID=82378 RepID=UPI003B21387B